MCVCVCVCVCGNRINLVYIRLSSMLLCNFQVYNFILICLKNPNKNIYIHLPYQNTKYNFPDFNPYYLSMTHFLSRIYFGVYIYQQILIFCLITSCPQLNFLIIFPLNTTYNNWILVSGTSFLNLSTIRLLISIHQIFLIS